MDQLGSCDGGMTDEIAEYLALVIVAVFFVVMGVMFSRGKWLRIIAGNAL
jgi:hypothetical protein